MSGRDAILFGSFRLIPAERRLLRGEDTVDVGSRALDVLIALTEAAGEVVGRAELLARAWPDVVVGEGSLRVTVASLRRALGDGLDDVHYISNVTGRGYCFVGAVHRVGAASTQSPDPMVISEVPPVTIPKFPSRPRRMIGRDCEVETLSKRLISSRFVSIVGPGGTGKTTVAIAVAHALLDEFGEAVYFADLGAITDPSLVASAVAAALGVFGQKQDPLSGLLAYLTGRRILLVLDNCEHVIDAVVTLAEALHHGAPCAHILTTTREALRAEGEQVYLLQPLDYPTAREDLTAAEALATPAVRLFMERALASGHASPLSDDDAPTAAAICGRLDGIALAIELAGSRVGTYGLRQTADLLSNRFKLVWQGRRSALPRHQTLSAMLDWSFNLLCERDQLVFRRVSIFAGIFTLEAAQAVVVDDEVDAMDVAEAIASLVSKSLIWVVRVDQTAHYRLLDPTHAYAVEKLARTREGSVLAKRHALFAVQWLSRASGEALSISGEELAATVPHLGDIRAALEWSFSEAGDRAIGVQLAAAAVPLFFEMSLLIECMRWCEQGLAALSAQDDQGAIRLPLQATLAASAMFTKGNSDEVRRSIEEGLQLADALGHPRYQMYLQVGLGIFMSRIGNFRGALEIAERGYAVTQKIGGASVIAAGESILGFAHHFVGDQVATQHHCERALADAAAAPYFGCDHEIRALIALARCYWLRGSADRAARTAKRVVLLAVKRDQPINLCMTLIYSATVFLWRGDLDEADQLIQRLLTQSARHSLDPYHSVGVALSGELAIARGKAGEGVSLLKSALGQLQAERHHAMTPALHVALGEGLLKAGAADEAGTVVEAGLALSEAFGETLNVPELLRIRAEAWLHATPPDPRAAEEAFRRAQRLANDQSAVSLELRSAMGLARLWADQGRTSDAADVLEEVYLRLGEGWETEDVRRAGQLLAVLGRPDGRLTSMSERA
jgi:predicted ATPase/DNA-binding winged helix-turn-helix (wHTH) protein